MLRLLAREGWMTSICRVVMGFYFVSPFAIFFSQSIFCILFSSVPIKKVEINLSETTLLVALKYLSFFFHIETCIRIFVNAIKFLFCC